MPCYLQDNIQQLTLTITQPSDNGLYELVSLPRDLNSGEVRDSATDGRRGSGAAAIFIARNRFAVLDKTAQTIEIRDLSNSITKSIKCPVQTNDIFYGGTACLLLSTGAAVVLYDIQQQKILAEIATPPVKYVVWNNDGNMVALLSKHSTFSFAVNGLCGNQADSPLPRSHHDRQQDAQSERSCTRDNQDQVRCLGRYWSTDILYLEPYQILLTARVGTISTKQYL